MRIVDSGYQRSARILDPGNSRRESASFFLARPREMIFWSLDLVSKHESNKMESRSRLEIREWSYDNLDLVSPGESKKNNSQSRLEKLHFLSRVRVRLQPNYRAVHCTEGNHMMWFLLNNCFGVVWKYFLWCLKDKFQITPLCSVMFVINTTTVLLQVPVRLLHEEYEQEQSKGTNCQQN